MTMRHLQMRFLTFAAGLCLAADAGGSLAMSPQETAVSAMGAPVRLSCESLVPLADSQQAILCDALQSALKSAFPARQFQMVPSPGRSGRPGTDGFWIRFKITRADTYTLEGHLEWAPGALAAEKGPTISLSAVDSPLITTMYPSLARSLVKASPLPLAASAP